MDYVSNTSREQLRTTYPLLSDEFSDRFNWQLTTGIHTHGAGRAASDIANGTGTGGNVYHYGSMSNFLGLIRLLNEQQSTINKLKKARDESDKFIIKKGLEAEFLNWVVENDE
jgi:hypothetical protein